MNGGVLQGEESLHHLYKNDSCCLNVEESGGTMSEVVTVAKAVARKRDLPATHRSCRGHLLSDKSNTHHGGSPQPESWAIRPFLPFLWEEKRCWEFVSRCSSSAVAQPTHDYIFWKRVRLLGLEGVSFIARNGEVSP